MKQCDLCSVTLIAPTSKLTGRCAPCRQEHGEPYRTPQEKVRDAAEILGATIVEQRACGECPSCDQGHPERCRKVV